MFLCAVGEKIDLHIQNRSLMFSAADVYVAPTLVVVIRIDIHNFSGRLNFQKDKQNLHDSEIISYSRFDNSWTTASHRIIGRFLFG